MGFHMVFQIVFMCFQMVLMCLQMFFFCVFNHVEYGFQMVFMWFSCGVSMVCHSRFVSVGSFHGKAELMASDTLASRALREGPLEARCTVGCGTVAVGARKQHPKKWGEWDVQDVSSGLRCLIVPKYGVVKCCKHRTCNILQGCNGAKLTIDGNIMVCKWGIPIG